MRILGIGALASAAVGVAWGCLEIWHLRAGGVPIPADQLGATLVLFALLGIVFAAPAIVLAALVASRSRSPWLARAAAALPGFAAALAFVAILVNVEWLPRLWAPSSLIADLGMVLATLLAIGLFARRPWRRGGDWALLAIAIVGSAAAWIATAPRPALPPAAVATSDTGTRAPDVFLILIDTLRADHLDAYGYTRPVSPHIGALAAEGIVMDRAFSTTNWTRPAVASLFTSTMPSRHAVTNLDRAVPESFPLLAESLKARGYQTGFFTVGINVEPSDGYQRGADHFTALRSRHLADRTLVMSSFVLHFFPWTGRLLPWTKTDRDSVANPALLVSSALDWVHQADTERPVFSYLHFLGPHSPYRPPPDFDRFSSKPHDARLENPPSQWAGQDALTPEETQEMIDLYDGEVFWNDDAVGKLIDGLRAAGRLDNAVVILIADHGEAFGKHGVWGHNASGFRSVVRIPMIFWSSPSIGLNRRTRLTIPASLMDVAPTVLDLAGQPAPAGFDGQSLVPWLRGASAEDRTVFVENPNNDELGVRTLDWAYFEGKTGDGFGRWLFEAKDTDQVNNLVETRPDVAERLHSLAEERRTLDRGRAGSVTSIDLDDTRRKMLEELGYVTK